MKIAIYDFCDTIVNFQTADEYVFFTKKYLRINNFWSRFIGHPMIDKGLRRNWKLRKKAILFQLKGLKKDILLDAADEYYKKRVRPNIYKSILDKIEEQKAQGFHVYLVSAGYSIYLDFFAREFCLDGVIANDFKYHKERFSGVITKSDCYGDNKVIRLNEYFDGKDVDYSMSFSDSISDLPMLKWSDDGIVVSREGHRKWVSENGLKDYVLSEHGNSLLGVMNSNEIT